MNSQPRQDKAPTYPTLYLRSTALVVGLFWLMMPAGLAMLMLGMLMLLSRYRSLYLLFWIESNFSYVFLLWMGSYFLGLGYLSTVLLEPLKTARRWIPMIPWRGHRPRLLFGGFLLVTFGLQLFFSGWDEYALYDEGWDLILAWTIELLLIPLVTAVILALATELTLVGATPVLLQLRGWRKLPFEDWDRSILWRFEHGSHNFGRWPKPVGHKMSIEQAKAYAWLAASIARQRGLLGEGIVLVCGGALGTSLALLFSTTSMDEWSLHPWAFYVAMFSVVLGFAGQRLSIFAAAMWESRAETYKAFAANRGTRARWKSARSRMI
ncbi:hypothetical protein [Paenarthrobacter sp. NEAU-H11]|uniref:hypothetical protein n=1 Tax=Paenarthrobacter sp. NEAU-H11 TaxID=3423924 RepID=UPI003D34E57A